jgi:5-formyltetrahydrofolate cyclo-ligase
MRDEKARIRREVAELYRKLPAEELAERGAQARARLAAADEFRRAASFLLYASLPDEIDTAPLIDELLAAGKAVYLPVCRPGRAELDVVPIRSRGADLAPGHFGILEPRPGLAPAVAGDVQFALVPGRAFDRRGRRLGRGRGYYDRFLLALPAGVTRAALALDFQIFPAVPAAEHDQPVDLVATDRELIRVRPEPRP